MDIPLFVLEFGGFDSTRKVCLQKGVICYGNRLALFKIMEALLGIAAKFQEGPHRFAFQSEQGLPLGYNSCREHVPCIEIDAIFFPYSKGTAHVFEIRR